MKTRVMTMCAAALLAAGGSRAEFPWEGQRVQVESTVFDAAAYHLEKRELTLWFDNGAVYAYLDVPSSLYGQFLESPRKGGFFHKHIKGRFSSDCRQVAARKSAPPKPVAAEPSPSFCLRAGKGGAS